MVIPENGNEAVEGQNFTLECQVAHADVILLVGGSISYSWTRGQSSGVLGTSMAYMFVPAAGDHREIYHCRANISSAARSLPIITNGATVIDVLGMKNLAMIIIIMTSCKFKERNSVVISRA